MHYPCYLELCEHNAPETSVERVYGALCRELPAADKAPEKIQLLPHRGEVNGRDGRRFFNGRPEALVQLFESEGHDLLLDYEHESESYGGKRAPAAGWIKKLEVDANGGIWGHVDWTPTGAAAVKNREYRYVSPAFFRDKEGQILKFSSAAITNTPNLIMQALNRRGAEGNSSMDLKELCRLLGLSETATMSEILAAIGNLRETNTRLSSDLEAARNAAPSLDKFVPRADYDAALNKVSAAQAELHALKQERESDKVEAALNEALKAGKITPATVEYHRAQCKTDGGLERFQKFVEAAPSLGDPSDLGSKPPPGGGASTSLNAEERQVAKLLGQTEEEFLEQKKKDQAAS